MATKKLNSGLRVAFVRKTKKVQDVEKEERVARLCEQFMANHHKREEKKWRNREV